jgi:hypothetical protein
MNPRLALTAVALALVAGACTNLGTAPSYKFTPSDAATQGPTQLYARDGSVVSGAASPSNDVAQRELAPSETGRTYILELYQRALDERDTLRRELDALGAELSTAQTALTQRESETKDLQARFAELEARLQRAVDENVDLAARLVTAQIRRLQAEKVLLEARIAQQQLAPIEAEAEHK